MAGLFGADTELSAARLRVALARLSRRLRPTEAAGSLTATEVDVLIAAERRGPIRLSDLANFAGLNPTMLSRLIPKLERAGLVRRLPDDSDRRVSVWKPPRPGRPSPRIRSERNDVLSRQLSELATPEPRGPRHRLARARGAGREARRRRPVHLRGRGPMSGLVSILRRTFSALSVPNFRRYFLGQFTSLIGTWMQTVAQSWLVYTLTHSATALGFVVALQTLPVLVLGPYAGVIADRVDKRKLMIVLQALMGLQALALGLLAVTHVVRFWQVCLLAVVLGLNNTFENPARQSFVLEMVGAPQLRNAVSLNSTMVNAARAIGPAIAGLLIATVGEGACFLVNAASFIAVVYSLVSMDKGALSPTKPSGRHKGQFREGIRYVKNEPRLGVPLVMVGLVGTLAYEFQVTLPVVARQTFHGGPATYGLLTAAMGAGAVLGGLVTAARGRTGLGYLTYAAVFFGLAIGFASLAPVLVVEFVALAAVGWASVTFLATGNSTLQLQSDPSMRGRVMSLWAVAFLGSTPVGGPVIGWIVASTSARIGLGTGGVACMLAAGIGYLAMHKLGMLHGRGQAADDVEMAATAAPEELAADAK